ncbi:MAG: beta-lactamase family protein [Anaerolineae bacterium]|nr:beta-lactamase family protein [Anaerolineae bacterium]
MLYRSTLLALALLALSFSAAPISAQSGTPISDEMLANFEQLIQSEQATFNVPGAAVAVISGNTVVYSKGFGVRDLATGEPFTTETRFRVGSTTKSMTSMLAATLVEQGSVTWDTPVTDLFPDFQTPNPELTAKITFGDLMSMSTGLVESPIGAFSWSDWDVNAILSAISTMTIGGDYQQFFSYNNAVYALSGYASAVAAGLPPTLDSYKTLIQERIFNPIGMPSAIITDDTSVLGDNYSQSYDTSIMTGEATLMDNPPIGVVAPAGGVWMNINDMARYVSTQMNGGVNPEGTRVVAADALAKTWEPGLSDPTQLPGVEGTAYAKGWVTETYFGVPLRWHNGGWAGYATQMTILPEDNVAVVIFSNTRSQLYNALLSYSFVELVRGLEPSAANAIHGYLQQVDGQFAQVRQLTQTEVGDVSAIVGTYENGLTVEKHEDQTLWISRGEAWRFQIGFIPLMNQYIALNNVIVGTTLSFATQDGVVTMVINGDNNSTINLKKIG